MVFIKYEIEYKGITYPCCCQMSKDIIQAVLQFDPTEWEVKELAHRSNCIERLCEPMNNSELIECIKGVKIFAENFNNDIRDYYVNAAKGHLLQRAKQFKKLRIDTKYINNELQTTPSGKTKHEKKTTAKEAALAYILDLYVKGERIPINEIEGGYNTKILGEIGEVKGFNPDTFYRAVKDIDTNFDLNVLSDLNNISLRWYKKVLELSEDPDRLKKYLIHKQLI